jgi:hypothetical protein
VTLITTNNLNEWADFWRYEIGVNVIPADTRNKKPTVNWKDYQNKPIMELQHEQWKKDNAFSDGMAIIVGKTWHNRYKKGLYLIFIDLDNEKAIEEFCTREEKVQSLDELSKRIIIEQHKDCPSKAHAFFYSRHPFRKKSSDRVGSLSGKIDANEIPAIEVKGQGSHGIAFVTPSSHKNGYNHEIIGTSDPDIIDELEEHIDTICKKYSLLYLNGSSNSNYLIPIADLDKPETVIFEGHNRHQELLRRSESLIRINFGVMTYAEDELKAIAAKWNQIHCRPPLDNREFERQWKDAMNFITKKIKEYESQSFTVRFDKVAFSWRKERLAK